MNLVLGIYGKSSGLKPVEINSMLANFSTNRKVKTIKTNNFQITSSSDNLNEPNYSLSQKENVIVAISGNILNYTDAKNYERYKDSKLNFSCSEYILEQYLKTENIDFSFFDGEFTIAIYDGNKDSLTVANNVFGTFPLFTFSDNNYFIFCNEYEPILKYLNFDNEISKTNIAEYLVLGSPINGKTFFKSITNLSPATQLNLHGKSINKKRYYNPNLSINSKLTKTEIAQKFSILFTDTIKKRIKNSESKNCSLSGGLDTRLILSAMSLEDRKHVTFTSLLTEPLNETNDRDILIASQIAARLDLNYQIIPMSNWWNVWSKAFDESYFTDLRYPQMPYIFSGHYGSELVKGEFSLLIPSFIQDIINQNKDHSIDLIASKFYKSKIIDSILNSKIYHKNFKEYFHQAFENLFTELKSYNTENKLLLFAINQMTRSFFSTMYSGSFGSWLMTYRFPTVWNLPFIDRNILELLLSVPVEILIDKNQSFYNEIYKNNFPELIDIPTSSSFGSIESNCISYFDDGKEPKNEHKPHYQNAFDQLVNNERTKELKVFNLKQIKKYSGQKNSIEIRPPIEFATWLEYVNSKFD